MSRRNPYCDEGYDHREDLVEMGECMACRARRAEDEVKALELSRGVHAENAIKYKELLVKVDMTLRGALVWAGVSWGEPSSVEWALEGAVEAIRERDALKREFAKIAEELKLTIEIITMRDKTKSQR